MLLLLLATLASVYAHDGGRSSDVGDSGDHPEESQGRAYHHGPEEGCWAASESRLEGPHYHLLYLDAAYLPNLAGVPIIVASERLLRRWAREGLPPPPTLAPTFPFFNRTFTMVGDASTMRMSALNNCSVPLLPAGVAPARCSRPLVYDVSSGACVPARALAWWGDGEDCDRDPDALLARFSRFVFQEGGAPPLLRICSGSAAPFLPALAATASAENFSFWRDGDPNCITVGNLSSRCELARLATVALSTTPEGAGIGESMGVSSATAASLNSTFSRAMGFPVALSLTPAAAPSEAGASAPSSAVIAGAVLGTLTLVALAAAGTFLYMKRGARVGGRQSPPPSRSGSWEAAGDQGVGARFRG